MSKTAAESVSALALADVRELCRTGRARQIRQIAELYIAEVAREVGVSEPTVSMWERGEVRPTGRRAIRYGALLRDLEAQQQKVPVAA